LRECVADRLGDLDRVRLSCRIHHDADRLTSVDPADGTWGLHRFADLGHVGQTHRPGIGVLLRRGRRQTEVAELLDVAELSPHIDGQGVLRVVELPTGEDDTVELQGFGDVLHGQPVVGHLVVVNGDLHHLGAVTDHDGAPYTRECFEAGNHTLFQVSGEDDVLHIRGRGQRHGRGLVLSSRDDLDLCVGRQLYAARALFQSRDRVIRVTSFQEPRVDGRVTVGTDRGDTPDLFDPLCGVLQGNGDLVLDDVR